MRFHKKIPAGERAMLVGTSCLSGFFALDILGGNPNEEMVMWGLGLGVIAIVTMMTAIRGFNEL